MTVKVLVAFVAAYDGTRTFADADPRANIGITYVVDYEWTGIIVPDAGVVVFKADVFLDDRGRPFHRADPAPHIPVGDVVE